MASNDETNKPAETRRPRIPPAVRRAVILLLIAGIAVVAGIDLVKGFGQIAWRDLHFDILALAGGLALIAMHEFLCGVTLQLSVRSLGERVGLRPAVAAYWSSGLGKYIPGKVATVAGAVAVLARFKLRPATAAVATFLHTGVHVLVGLLIALPPLLTPATPLGWTVRGLCVAVALVCLHPRVFLAIGNFLLVRMKREPIRTRPATGWMFVLLLATAGRFAVLGAGIWLTARSVVPSVGPEHLWLITSTAVGATVIGFLVFFAPAGIGVREDIYMRVLGGVIREAALIAVLTRFAQTVVELGLAGVGLLMLRRKAEPAATETPADIPAPQTQASLSQ